MPTWNDVVERFASRKPNPRAHGRIEWSATPSSSWHSAGTVVRAYCEDNKLYSYGPHFILAVDLGDRDSKPFFLKNGDKNSNTTTKQQSEVQSRCQGPTVSFSALETSGIFDDIANENIIDWREDSRTRVYRDKASGRFYLDYNRKKRRFEKEFKNTEQGMFLPWPSHKNPEMGEWHILGSVLIHVRGDYYLASLDENSYFVTKLAAGPVLTVDQAFESLKPEAVREAEGAGKAVKRQGEWFFIPTGMDDGSLAARMGITKARLGKLARISNLPHDRNSNVHEVRHLKVGEVTYARGKVFHRAAPLGRMERGPLTREHRTLDLGQEWHEVHKNVQKQSWSQGGKFD